MGKFKEILTSILQAIKFGVSWDKISWAILRPLIISLLKKSASKLTGPVGWIAFKLIPILTDKYIKPGFQWVKRKINKSKNKKKGKQKAKDIRDASTDNVDDIYDNMRK